jgi:hypothetical protein
MGAGLLSDNQKADSGQQVLLLLTALTIAEKRTWVNLWTVDES